MDRELLEKFNSVRKSRNINLEGISIGTEISIGYLHRVLKGNTKIKNGKKRRKLHDYMRRICKEGEERDVDIYKRIKIMEEKVEELIEWKKKQDMQEL